MNIQWSKNHIREKYETALFDLMYEAAEVLRKYHKNDEIQICSLISIKTGGCPENCKYCPQAARYQTHVVATPFMEEEEIMAIAKKAIEKGATRICLGAAWRGVRDSPQFDLIVKVVRKITDLGVEVCCTLGILNEEQAKKLKQAGLYAYNHNLDTSKEFYSEIITTRSYEDRLNTIHCIKNTHISVCCGGIIGMGESIEDRINLIYNLSCIDPESVPINLLVPVPGTPLEGKEKLPIWDVLRMIATTRIVIPKAMIRLSAGRLDRSKEEQALCFLAGANSIFSGEKLLTCPNPDFDADQEMMQLFGLKRRPSFREL